MVARDAFAADALRVLRLARLACELRFEIETATRRPPARRRRRSRRVARSGCSPSCSAGCCAPQPLHGLELMAAPGVTAAVLPELDALDGVEQSRFHHLDVLDHTRRCWPRPSSSTTTRHRCVVRRRHWSLREWLSAPLANELTRGQALRFGALLHDIAKPQTRAMTA